LHVVGALVGHLGVGFGAFVAFGLRHIGFSGFRLGVGILIFAFLLLGILILIVAGLVRLVGLVELVAVVQVLEDRLGEFGESFLIAQKLRQFFHFLAGAFFDPRPPQIDGGLGVFGRRFASKFLADQQTEDIGDGRIAFDFDLGEAFGGETGIETGGEVLRNALHGDGADGFDACLFGGFEHRGGFGGLRAQGFV